MKARLGRALETVLGAISATVLFVMMLLTAVDVAGRSVQEAAFLAVFMERMARQQIDAEKVGGAKPVDAAEARRARDFLRTDRIMGLTFDAWARRAERRRPSSAAASAAREHA